VNEPLLTARKLADRLSVSTGALLRWTRAGLVPGAVKMPSGAVRYRPDRIEAWLDELAMGAAEQEVSATRTNRAHDEPYAPLSFSLSAIPPRSAAYKNREEHNHAC
jgi:predicted DNA-binding transcriptional regulator AlpA